MSSTIVRKATRADEVSDTEQKVSCTESVGLQINVSILTKPSRDPAETTILFLAARGKTWRMQTDK